MTIAALLRHHGVQTPRYVTVAGQIVFDDVAVTSTGPVHREYGAVTSVAPHTFHGGDEGEDEVAASASEWWDDEALVARHMDEMKTSFPNFEYLPAEEDRCPAWIGQIDTGRGKFKVLIMTRRDQGLPRVAVIDHRLGANAGRKWQPSPHLFTNGNLCVADQDDWDPAQHTAATVTGWAAHWLAAYTEWRLSRRWPVKGVQSVAMVGAN